MKTPLPKAITSVAEAKAFLKALYDNDEEFHPEDAAEDIINGRTGQRLFTDEEAIHVNALREQIYALPETTLREDGTAEFDPCGYLLDLGNNELKHFFLTDKTGRGYSCLVTDWHGFDADNDEEDYNGDRLEDFIRDAEVGDVWENSEKEVKRVQ